MLLLVLGGVWYESAVGAYVLLPVRLRVFVSRKAGSVGSKGPVMACHDSWLGLCCRDST